MTRFEDDPKVGDWIKVTVAQTYEGEVKKFNSDLNLAHLDSGRGFPFVVDLDGGCCFDSGDVTVEKIDPPLRQGWWEVSSACHGTTTVMWWSPERDGWRTVPDGMTGPSPFPHDEFTPLHFLGLGSKA